MSSFSLTDDSSTNVDDDSADKNLDVLFNVHKKVLLTGGGGGGGGSSSASTSGNGGGGGGDNGGGGEEEEVISVGQFFRVSFAIMISLYLVLGGWEHNHLHSVSVFLLLWDCGQRTSIRTLEEWMSTFQDLP